MKPFRGPRYQGGWIGIAVAAVGAYASSREQSASKKDANKMNYADSRDLANLSFQQNEWLNEQARKWQLQDKQFDMNYKENAIGGFRDTAPANVLTQDGSFGAAPAPTQLDTSGLAPRQANGQAAIIDPRTGQPVNANAQPLSQFG
jgi:hypothetical protein